jgi:hypothetical protein
MDDKLLGKEIGGIYWHDVDCHLLIFPQKYEEEIASISLQNRYKLPWPSGYWS